MQGTIIRVLSIICLLGLLAACGQKGPLILPEEAPSTNPQ